MKRTNNGPILSALSFAQAFFFPVDNRKRNKNPWLKTNLPKWLEMIKTNMVYCFCRLYLVGSATKLYPPF